MSATECHTYCTTVNGNACACYIGCITATIYITYCGVALVDYVNNRRAVYGSFITTTINITSHYGYHGVIIQMVSITDGNLRVTVNNSSTTQASAKDATAYCTVGYSNNRIITLIVF